MMREYSSTAELLRLKLITAVLRSLTFQRWQVCNPHVAIPRMQHGFQSAHVHPGTWQLGAAFARGSWGTVHAALDTATESVIAVKCIDLCRHRAATDGPAGKEDSKLQGCLAEVYLLRRLHHPNIVRYLGAELQGTQLVILQELCEGGCIGTLLLTEGRFSAQRTAHYTHQILQALLYLHSCSIVHRDLKADNLLLTADGVVKLADFGTSLCLLDDGPLAPAQRRQCAGSPLFMPPEALLHKRVGLAVDIWSLGCTVLQMLTGKPPSFGKRLASVPALIKHLQSNPRAAPAIPHHIVTSDFTSLLAACFNWDFTARPTAHGLLLRFPVCTAEACHTCCGADNRDSSNDNCINPVRCFSSTTSCRTAAVTQCSSSSCSSASSSSTSNSTSRIDSLAQDSCCRSRVGKSTTTFSDHPLTVAKQKQQKLLLQRQQLHQSFELQVPAVTLPPSATRAAKPPNPYARRRSI